MRLALGRWADEDAAPAAKDPDVGRRALLAVAASLLVAQPSLAAFSAAEPTCERLEALDRDAPRPRVLPHVLVYFPGTALSTAALVALASWTNAASAVVAMAGQCA